jgi:hypothetical protein
MKTKLSFWLMFAAMVFHSLGVTIFTGFGFMIWLMGCVTIWLLFLEATGGIWHNLKGYAGSVLGLIGLSKRRIDE